MRLALALAGVLPMLALGQVFQSPLSFPDFGPFSPFGLPFGQSEALTTGPAAAGAVTAAGAVQAGSATGPSGAVTAPTGAPAPLPAPEGEQDKAGPLDEVYAWRQMDFHFPSEEARAAALATGTFDPSGTLPLGIEVWGSRLFLALPRWRSGSPATLAWVPRDPADARNARSPRLVPFPGWEWHGRPDCQGLTSVFRMAADRCGRLWVLDSGAVDVVTGLRQQCPPQLLIFDLQSDQLLRRHVLPQDQVKEGSLFSNIVLDVRGERCEDSTAFLADVWRFGLVVYSLADASSFRAEHSFFLPDPLRTDYALQDLTWTWRDGVFGLALGAQGRDGDRPVYLHSMSSFRQFAASANTLRAPNGTDALGAITLLPEPRGYSAAQASAAAIDKRGVMFYTLVARNGIGCWNTQHPAGYRTALQGVAAQDNDTLVFPNDLKLTQDRAQQSLWVISNRLPFFLYSELDPKAVNFRIFTAPTATLTEGTVCDPEDPPAAPPSRPACDL